MENITIETKDLKKRFNTQWALNGVSLSLEEGKQYAIRGASGSGKSTLLYLLGGLDRQTSGNILVDGKDLGRFSDSKLAVYRNSHVGFIFQFHFLLSSMNCLDNIFLPGRIAGISPSKYKSEVLDLASHLGISEMLKKYPYQLSGGEQQRVNIIRALSLHPKLLLCDEPTGNLDSKNSDRVASLLKELAQAFGSTLVVVTHDEHVASYYENQLFLEDGVLKN